jgi:hypothetical protein
MYPDCGKDFSRKFICDNFANAFVTGELKKHRENIYYEQEKALLPATQARVADIIFLKNFRNASKSFKKRKYEILEKKNRCLDILPGITNYNDKTERGEYHRKRQAIFEIYDAEYREAKGILELVRRTNPIFINTDPEPGKHRFIRPCTDTGCKGFLSTAWKCGLCKKRACSKCHVVLEGDMKEHVCNEDTLATAKLIVSQSKPCPGCHINISKIDGCNQIWCTVCKTAWDWKSGCIETKVHNPHYFEYMRNRPANEVVPRNPNEVRCGRELDHSYMLILNQIICSGEYGYTTRMRDMLIWGTAGIAHLQRFHMGDLGDSPNAESLRVKYMRNMIDKQQFKKGVHMLYKKFYKDKEIQEVLVMLRHLTIEIGYRYLEDFSVCITAVEKRKVSTLDEIETLVAYANECLKSIAKTYQSTVMVVSLDPEKKTTYGLKSVNVPKL